VRPLPPFASGKPARAWP